MTVWILIDIVDHACGFLIIDHSWILTLAFGLCLWIMASMAAEAPDVCYSWWILSALVTIDRAHWIDMEKLVRALYQTWECICTCVQIIYSNILLYV